MSTSKQPPPDTTAEAFPPLKAPLGGDLDREKAAQAGDTNAPKSETATAKSETPPAGAGLIEMDAKQSPSNEPGYRVGDYIKVKMTAKNWRAAGQEAVITDVIQAGASYKVKYGQLSMESAGVSETEIDGRLPKGKKPAWLKEEQSSASDEANEKTIEIFKPDHVLERAAFYDIYCRRCAKDQGMREGLPDDAAVPDDYQVCDLIGASSLYKKEADGYPKEWRYQGGVATCTAFVEFGAEPDKGRCDKTIDMFEGAAA